MNVGPIRIPVALLQLVAMSAWFVVLNGCGGNEGAAPEAAAPPPAVTVAEAGVRELADDYEFVGRTVSVQDVSLKARVDGYLVERKFTEGQDVEAGDELLVIDQAPYEAAVAQVNAELAQAEASLAKAKKDLARYQDLVKKGAVSKERFDKAETDRLTAAADVKAQQAKLQQAQLDLDYAVIKAPIRGRIGRVVTSVGNLVGPQSGELARIVELDPLYVTFSISERDMVNFRERQIEQGKSVGVDDFDAVIELRLANGSVYGHQGRLDFVDNRVDPTTGTIAVRAVFENRDGLLLPGQFVTVIVRAGETEEAMLIPQAAVQEDQAGRFVLVVDEENKVETRRVLTGRQHGSEWVIEQGLSPGERVVVEGLQKVRPGVEVNPTLQSRPAAD